MDLPPFNQYFFDSKTSDVYEYKLKIKIRDP